MRKPSLSQRQKELKKLLDEKLKNYSALRKNRVYDWLNDNQYFVDDELFDFYLCVAQNLAAVEELGGCGLEIIKAKQELEVAAEAYKQNIIQTSEQVAAKQEYLLKKTQSKMVQKSQLEHQKLLEVSTRLFNANVMLMAKQKKLLSETEAAKTASRNTVLGAVATLVMTLLALSRILSLKG
jgi:hypothetical protein